MPVSDAVRIRHILDAARQATAFVQGRSRTDLDADHMLSLALVRAARNNWRGRARGLRVVSGGPSGSRLDQNGRDARPPHSRLLRCQFRRGLGDCHAGFAIRDCPGGEDRRLGEVGCGGTQINQGSRIQDSEVLLCVFVLQRGASLQSSRRLTVCLKVAGIRGLTGRLSTVDCRLY
jgi:hypothetical protein